MSLDKEKFPTRILQKCLLALGENSFTSLIETKGVLPDGKKLTYTQIASVITIISICDEAVSMSLPKSIYAQLFMSLVDVAIPFIPTLENITIMNEVEAYVTGVFQEEAHPILIRIAKFTTPAWKEEFKLEDNIIRRIESIPDAQVFISKIIIFIKILSHSFVNECMSIIVHYLSNMVLNKDEK